MKVSTPIADIVSDRQPKSNSAPTSRDSGQSADECHWARLRIAAPSEAQQAGRGRAVFSILSREP